MPRLSSSIAALVVACVLPGSQVAAQDSWSLTDAERAMALAAERAIFDLSRSQPQVTTMTSAALPSLAGTTKAKDRKSVLVSVTPVGSRSTVKNLAASIDAAGISQRRAIVTRFEYATGETVRTWVDLGSGDVLRTRVDVNYPTPLAQEELDEATALWRAKIPEVDSAYKEAPDKVQMLHLVPLAPHISSPFYGHRVVVMWLTAPIATRKYLVDLSTEEVIEK